MDAHNESCSPFVAPIRLRNLLWVPVLACTWLAATVYGTPHLRVQYSYSGKRETPRYRSCNYWGLSSFRVTPPDGACPLIVLMKTDRKG